MNATFVWSSRLVQISIVVALIYARLTLFRFNSMRLDQINPIG